MTCVCVRCSCMLCEFLILTTSYYYVLTVKTADNGLRGYLPWEISQLRQLQILYLRKYTQHKFLFFLIDRPKAES